MENEPTGGSVCCLDVTIKVIACSMAAVFRAAFSAATGRLRKNAKYKTNIASLTGRNVE
ncbi:MAG: hypothetical protein LBG58_04725 [Planctomycetaceae bacterium]|nr:hypothetical protein [Planctomycetaceae bacterium]